MGLCDIAQVALPAFAHAKEDSELRALVSGNPALYLICPRCGGPLGGAFKEFKCQGHYRKDWRSDWESDGLSRRRSAAQPLKLQADGLSATVAGDYGLSHCTYPWFRTIGWSGLAHFISSSHFFPSSARKIRRQFLAARMLAGFLGRAMAGRVLALHLLDHFTDDRLKLEQLQLRLEELFSARSILFNPHQPQSLFQHPNPQLRVL